MSERCLCSLDLHSILVYLYSVGIFFMVLRKVYLMFIFIYHIFIHINPKTSVDLAVDLKLHLIIANNKNTLFLHSILIKKKKHWCSSSSWFFFSLSFCLSLCIFIFLCVTVMLCSARFSRFFILVLALMWYIFTHERASQFVVPFENWPPANSKFSNNADHFTQHNTSKQ